MNQDTAIEESTQNIMTRHQYPVKYEFAYDFKQLAVEHGCVYKNMIELRCCVLLSCHLDVPKDKEDLINDMAFQTFIKNPEFQKYYDLSKLKKENNEIQ